MLEKRRGGIGNGRSRKVYKTTDAEPLRIFNVPLRSITYSLVRFIDSPVSKAFLGLSRQLRRCLSSRRTNTRGIREFFRPRARTPGK